MGACMSGNVARQIGGGGGGGGGRDGRGEVGQVWRTKIEGGRRRNRALLRRCCARASSQTRARLRLGVTASPPPPLSAPMEWLSPKVGAPWHRTLLPVWPLPLTTPPHPTHPPHTHTTTTHRHHPPTHPPPHPPHPTPSAPTDTSTSTPQAGCCGTPSCTRSEQAPRVRTALYCIAPVCNLRGEHRARHGLNGGEGLGRQAQGGQVRK